MNYPEKLRKMVRDGQIAPAVIDAVELVEAVLSAIEAEHGKEVLDNLGWELCRVQGETHDIALVRCVGSHIIHTRCSNWQAKEGG